MLGYNKWQEYRFRREADGRLKSSHDDVLMGQTGSATASPPVRPDAGPARERVEPTFNGPDAPAADGIVVVLFGRAVGILHELVHHEVMRHADAGYEIARACAHEQNLNLPMLGR